MLLLLLIFLVGIASIGGLFSGMRHVIGASLLLSQLELNPTPSTTSACFEDINPSRTIVTCRELGLLQGSLRSCKSNENCFSTSSKTATKRVQPWYYSGRSPEAVFQVLKDAAQLEGLTVLQAKQKELYLLAAEKEVPKQPAGSSLFYEFFIKPEDGVVLYRGVVDKTVFVYPLQQPVSDFGALKTRLDGVFRRSGLQQDDDSYEKIEYRSPFLFQ